MGAKADALRSQVDRIDRELVPEVLEAQRDAEDVIHRVRERETRREEMRRRDEDETRDKFPALRGVRGAGDSTGPGGVL
jgi:hypothetical protein